jgi:hypothetical protein
VGPSYAHAVSAKPLKADLLHRDGNVRNVPQPDITPMASTAKLERKLVRRAHERRKLLVETRRILEERRMADAVIE